MRAFDVACGTPWAITRESLELILSVASRTHRESIEALETRLGRQLDNTRETTVHGRTAVVPITGPIFRHANMFTQISGATSLGTLSLDLARAVNDPAIDTIVLAIDSPGGEAAGINEFAKYVSNVGASKPVIAYVENVAASAAYWIASAANEIVIDETAKLGSIGVIAVADARTDDGTVEIVSSQSPKKHLDPATDAGRAEMQSVVDALADVFIGAVAANRNVSPEDVIQRFGQGGLLVGKYALEAGLADRIGSLDGVLSELAQRGVQSTGPKLPNRTTEEAVQEENIQATIEALEASGVSGEVVAALKRDVQQMREQYASSEAANLALTQRVERMERKEMEEYFRSEVLGHATGIRWNGNAEEQIAFLTKLADATGGRESEMVKQYVTQQRQLANQLTESALLSEYGVTGGVPGNGMDAKTRLEQEARQLMEGDRGLSIDQAMVRVMSEQPTLREEFYREFGVVPSRNRGR